MIERTEQCADGWRLSCKCGFSAVVRLNEAIGDADSFGPNLVLAYMRAGSRFELMHAHANPECKPDPGYVNLPQVRTARVKL
jgi:hypothetical protein